MARFSGEVTQLELGTNTNTREYFVITVLDNGQGAKATGPDMIHHRRDSDPIDCETDGQQPISTVTGGNLRAH